MTWVSELHAAYLAAPGRLTAHALPLVCDDLAALLRWLDNPRGALADEAGRRLCGALRTALQAHELNLSPHEPRLPDDVLSTLDELHAALWTHHPRPKLVVYDTPALAHGEFTRGRAVSLPDRQVVAVSLDVDPTLAAIQILHEATHAVTDPLVEPTDVPRDTAADSPGFAAHTALEKAAVDHGQHIIESVAPHWLSPYADWRAHHRI